MKKNPRPSRKKQCDPMREKILRQAREIELLKRQAHEEFNTLMSTMEMLVDEMRDWAR